MVRIVPAKEPVPTHGFEPSLADRQRSFLAQAVLPQQQVAPSSGFGNVVQQALAAPALPTQRQGILADIVAKHASTMPMVDDSSLSRLGEQIASARVKGPGFFDQGGTGRKILQSIGDFALNFSASQGDPAALMTLRNRAEQVSQRAAWERQDAQRAEDRRWQVEDRDARTNAPQYFNAGRDRVRLDPATGKTEVVYDAPEDYETYAGSMGLHPGDEGYDGAVQDYVLRGNGPTSQAARLALDKARQVDRLALEGTRQAGRQALRSSPTYANLHPTARRTAGASGPPKSTSAVVAPILLKLARGGTLTAGEQQALSYSRGGGRAGSLPVVSSPADAAKLPSGTRFKTPDGRTKVAP